MNKVCTDLVTSIDYVSVSRSFDHKINANDRIPKNFASVFNINACVLLGMVLRCVILYFVARTVLYSCTVCVSGL